MKPKLQRIEVERAISGDHYFAVEHRSVGQFFTDRLEQFRKVAVQRFSIAALDVDFVVIAKDEGPESIPLRFEDPICGHWQFADAFVEHRQHRRVNGKVHELILYCDLAFRHTFICEYNTTPYDSKPFSKPKLCCLAFCFDYCSDTLCLRGNCGDG